MPCSHAALQLAAASIAEAIADEERDPGHASVLPHLKGARTQLDGALNGRLLAQPAPLRRVA